MKLLDAYKAGEDYKKISKHFHLTVLQQFSLYNTGVTELNSLTREVKIPFITATRNLIVTNII